MMKVKWGFFLRREGFMALIWCQISRKGAKTMVKYVPGGEGEIEGIV